MGNVSMHEWKMPLKYWGKVLTLSGPLGLGQAADTMSGGGVPYKREGHVDTSKMNVGISTMSLGPPHYSSPPLLHHLLSTP